MSLSYEGISGEEVSSLNIFCLASEKMRDAWSEEMEICGMRWKKKSDAWLFRWSLDYFTVVRGHVASPKQLLFLQCTGRRHL